MKKLRRSLNKISEHFSTPEFNCSDGCGQCIINGGLVFMLEHIRAVFGSPVIVHCVNRCKEHNEKVGGTKTSKHIGGSAADFHVAGISIDELHQYMRKSHNRKGIINGGLGLYSWGVHIDTGLFRSWRGH